MTDTTRRGLLDAAERFAEEAAPRTLAHFRRDAAVDRKADETPVTAADRETEQALREAIAAAYPDHGILGEEFGAHGVEGEHVWVLDPIDGTKSFITGKPLFGMLIAVLEAGVPVAGVINMCALGERFAGGAGLGATLNGTPIRCRDGVALADAFLCVNETAHMVREWPQTLDRLLNSGRYARTTMDCYPYAQLAAGWVDAVVDCDLEPYDFLPLVGVVEGAGGVITDWRGHPLTLHSDGCVVAAGSAALHAELLDVVNAGA